MVELLRTTELTCVPKSSREWPVMKIPLREGLFFTLILEPEAQEILKRGSIY
jgi:hypothetical protein